MFALCTSVPVSAWKDIDEQTRLLTVRAAMYDGIFATPKFTIVHKRGQEVVRLKPDTTNASLG